MAGLSGKVYVGQSVQAKYTFTSENAWPSINDLESTMYKWNISGWVSVSGSSDLLLRNQVLKRTSSVSGNSTLGKVRVPDNSGSGSNKIRFKMTTQWYNDPSHTREESWIDIPVVKADVELYEIKLIGEDGFYVNPPESDDRRAGNDPLCLQEQHRL